MDAVFASRLYRSSGLYKDILMKTFVLLTTAVLLVAGSSGCLSIGSSIAPSSVPLEGRTYTELGPASGSVSSYYLLNIIPLSAGETKDAHAKAIESAGADGLISVTVDNIYVPIPIIGSWYITKVQGTAIKFTD